MARPPKKVNPRQVEALAKLQCTMIEMSQVLGVSVDTLERRFADIIERGREFGRMSIKRKQFAVAMKGSVPMLIWVGKQHLGQRDRQEMEHSGEVKFGAISFEGDKEITGSDTRASVAGALPEAENGDSLPVPLHDHRGDGQVRQDSRMPHLDIEQSLERGEGRQKLLVGCSHHSASQDRVSATSTYVEAV